MLLFKSIYHFKIPNDENEIYTENKCVDKYGLILIVSAVFLLTPSNVFKASAAPSFTYGMASGDIISNSAVLWAHTSQYATIQLDVTRFPNFDRLDFTRSVNATADNDFTAKITATGLMANTQYYYHWRAGSIFSDVGSFKTAPLDTQAIDLHFSRSGDTDSSKLAGNPNPVFGNWNAIQAARSE